MTFQDLSIRRKVMTVIMLTSLIALLLTVAVFLMYDLFTYRNNLAQNLSTVADIIANGSTAALTFQDEEAAQQYLGGLKAEPHVRLAAFYNADGIIFCHYPAETPISSFPAAPGPKGAHFKDGRLILFEPVVEKGKKSGTLYIESDLGALYQRMQLYGGIGLLVLGGSLVITLLLSSALQKRITTPILALAESARAVSQRSDYSIRAKKYSGDELGILTDAFNLMLARIEEQSLAARESEQRLRLALEASSTGTWHWNIQTGKIVWDEHLHALFGVASNSFNGTYDDFVRLIDSADREVFTRALNRAISDKSEFVAEFRVTHRDGSLRYLLARGRAVYLPTGTPARVSGVILDITERIRTEEIKSFLAAIVDSSDDAIIGKDLSGNILSWNAGAERMFGFTSQEMLGKPVTPLLSPDRADEESRVLEPSERAFIRHFETIRRRKDGTPIHVSLTVSPIRNSKNEIIGLSSIARDITDRIQAHEALQRHSEVLREQSQMLDLANVMARDLQDNIILWNTGMERLYGWRKSEALGKKAAELFQTKFPVEKEAIRAVLLKEGNWEGELLHTRKDGGRIFIHSQWILHHAADGQPIAILEINTDITERKLAQDQVLRLNAELEQRVEQRTSELTSANREMEAFTYSVAHDLRAPLRHIDAFTRILHEEFASDLPPEARRYLDSIRKGSRNMSRLVDDLLNLARVGRQELRHLPVRLDNLVTEVISDLQRETEGREIEWRISPLPVVQCDPGLMKLVFANLLSNAVKYSRPRKVAIIEIQAQQTDGLTTIQVRDNGVGFNMKYSDKLFGVFQRLHRAEEFEGTGVGLATVDRIVRRHGGTVWAEAAVDRGATFSFTIASPIAAPSSQTEAMRQSAQA